MSDLIHPIVGRFSDHRPIEAYGRASSLSGGGAAWILVGAIGRGKRLPV